VIKAIKEFLDKWDQKVTLVVQDHKDLLDRKALQALQAPQVEA
jgi:hypothetical protein